MPLIIAFHSHHFCFFFVVECQDLNEMAEALASLLYSILCLWLEWYFINRNKLMLCRRYMRLWWGRRSCLLTSTVKKQPSSRWAFVLLLGSIHTLELCIRSSLVIHLLCYRKRGFFAGEGEKTGNCDDPGTQPKVAVSRLVILYTELTCSRCRITGIQAPLFLPWTDV